MKNRKKPEETSADACAEEPGLLLVCNRPGGKTQRLLKLANTWATSARVAVAVGRK